MALVELIEHLPTRGFGAGNATGVLVTIGYDTLMSGIGAAGLDTGTRISARDARRLACNAAIIPAVLGGNSEVLDLGRTKRFYDRPQRIKALIEHRGCAVEGCDQPGTHMHHPLEWSKGGETNADGIPICPGHHTRAHDTRYTMTKLPTGKYGFHRRT